MNLITIIDSLAPFQFTHAEELSRSVIKSNQVGEEWLVPDSEDVVHVHLFPVVGDYGIFCPKCRGLYPNEICEHTAAVFLSAMPGICDVPDDAESEHVIRSNIQELRAMLSNGTEYFACLFASKELGGIADRDLYRVCKCCRESCSASLDKIYLEITKCVKSQELRERMFAEVRSVAFADSHIFNPYVSSHWRDLEVEENSALFRRKASS